jgi:hypothetical protein
VERRERAKVSPVAPSLHRQTLFKSENLSSIQRRVEALQRMSYKVWLRGCVGGLGAKVAVQVAGPEMMSTISCILPFSGVSVVSKVLTCDK